ncbi:MAG: hypothetical protein NDI60_05320 [Elusimicrobiales bacterium]|nr:hypothetical protein [Elusimicrobiales bacterium]
MKKAILFAGALYGCMTLLHAQARPVAQKEADGNIKGKGPRIERAIEKGKEILRFHDVKGRKTREISIENKNTQIRVSKSKPFDHSRFKIRISTQVADAIENTRKRTGRDISVTRREEREMSIERGGKFAIVSVHSSDFVEVADPLDSERAEDPVEASSEFSVYDAEGNDILTLENHGDGATISNTGNYFLVLNGSGGEHVINRSKEVLAEIPFVVYQAYFSPNDRYLVLVELSAASSECPISVYDTVNKKLELRKLSVDKMVFQSVDEIDISEEKREIVIRHLWDWKTRKVKTETFVF